MEKDSTDSSSWHVTAKHGYYSNGIVGRKAAITEEVFKKKSQFHLVKFTRNEAFKDHIPPLPYMKDHEENRTKRPLKIDVKSCKTQTETVRKSGHRADIPRASRCFLLFQEKRRKGSCSSRCSRWPRSRSLSYFYPCRHIHYTYIYI